MNQAYSLNLRHLGALLEVAVTGNISGAARTVNLSQPALAQAISKIEQTLDVSLFERRPGGVAMTDAGTRFIVRTERALAYLTSGVRQIRRGSGKPVLMKLEQRVTMSQLRALVSVVGAGSYAVAARQLDISQPSLHRAMRELQELVEIPLLERTGRAIRPTMPAGQLVHFVCLMLAELRAGIDEIATRNQGLSGTLRIGVLPVARSYFLSRVLAGFCTQWPAASVEIIEGPHAELLSHLRQGDVDLLIGSQREQVPTHDVSQEALFDDELVIVGRTGHPLHGKLYLTTADLLDHHWVMPAPGTPLRVNWERMFAARGQAPPILRVQCGSVTIKRGMMLEGDWLTLMSRDQFRLESQAGQLVEIGSPGADFWRTIALTRRNDWRPTLLQATFIELLRSVAAQMPRP
ncbi:LysR family transcriptional regulator [Sodalis sp. dw_96]|uniref:LysR family transcriptional regulator n=1 Tax=Sodalis sp. dw_96 TaxID=2719794 RepID=UPI001BD21BAA|nr:LysR family transcriptional regulator [Sodalis sp. dw_96]